MPWGDQRCGWQPPWVLVPAPQSLTPGWCRATPVSLTVLDSIGGPCPDPHPVREVLQVNPEPSGEGDEILLTVFLRSNKRDKRKPKLTCSSWLFCSLAPWRRSQVRSVSRCFPEPGPWARIQRPCSVWKGSGPPTLPLLTGALHPEQRSCHRQWHNTGPAWFLSPDLVPSSVSSSGPLGPFLARSLCCVLWNTSPFGSTYGLPSNYFAEKCEISAPSPISAASVL